MADLEKVRYPSPDTQTDMNTNTVAVALAQVGNLGQAALANCGWAGKLGPC